MFDSGQVRSFGFLMLVNTFGQVLPSFSYVGHNHFTDFVYYSADFSVNSFN